MSEQNSPSEPTTGQRETKPKKVVTRNVAVALGIICIILIAGLGATMAYYTMLISSKDNQNASQTGTINQLNAKIANLTLELNQLQASLNETETLLNQSLTPSVAQGVYDGFQLTLLLEKTNFSLGEPINITLILTNISNQSNDFWFSAYDDFDFQVYNNTYASIYRYSDYEIGTFISYVIWLRTFNPGESLSQYFVWPQTFYPPTGESTGIPVSPGTYYISGLIGSVLVANNTMETAPIQITVG